ncbi:MAG: hypothetical protein KC442_07225 [Thermomicrobiales bacterium]|nr:hypothetical protein [Thermomicrobiales bacterium]MCA9877554.1 hypothetical protein [Thermomicrobiales bacterium]
MSDQAHSPSPSPSPKRALRRAAGRYVISLPERFARASAALAGGALYETSQVALPNAVRDSKLYQVTVSRLLRILIEWVGDVQGIYDDEEMGASELAVRKFTGNIVEFASIFAVGFSPLWILAAASDVMGGSKAYLRTLVSELQQTGQLPVGTDIASYEELLQRLETGSGVLADTIDVPPLTVKDARASFESLRRQADDLPSAGELALIFRELQATAEKEGRSVSEVSAALAGAAARAGLNLGSAHIFDFYKTSLNAIQEEGMLRFLLRSSTPYVKRAGGHFDPRAATYTDRAMEYLAARRAGAEPGDAGGT